MSARDGAVSITSNDGRRWEFLNISEGPDDGETWPTYLQRRWYEFRAILGHLEPASRWQVVFRFSYPMARAMVKSADMARIFKYMNPEDYAGIFPTRLFGCRVIVESWPGAIFDLNSGEIIGPVEAQRREIARQQRVAGS